MTTLILQKYKKKNFNIFMVIFLMSTGNKTEEKNIRDLPLKHTHQL